MMCSNHYSLLCFGFFDDILIYSHSWAEHLQHVKAVLQQMRDHRLFAKRSKCSFGESSVAYLGHIISAQGVAMDAEKVAAVEAWPQPRSVRALRGFLGLTGYYRKFIAGYGGVAAPLTALLKREAFTWTADAQAAFIALKTALITAPLLQLPDFTKRFLVDCDASGAGCCTKATALLHFSAGRLLLTTPSCQLMSASSLGWSRLSGIGGLISGDARLLFAPTTGASSSSSTSAS